VETLKTDVAIVGAGGAGLRAAIAVAERDPGLRIALISKVYPMRSHTVAAEGGAAAVTQAHDSLEAHFHDTVAGGDWLCEQDVVEYFVDHAHEELVQMEHWGCPWSRKPDGHVNVRAFGGMKIERTWFAADKTGFHMLHTLFQTSMKYPSIQRLDEHFCLDLVVADRNGYRGVRLDDHPQHLGQPLPLTDARLDRRHDLVRTWHRARCRGGLRRGLGRLRSPGPLRTRHRSCFRVRRGRGRAAG